MEPKYIMNTNFEVLEKERLILEYFEGVVTIQNLNQRLSKVLNNPNYNKDFDVLSDLRKSIISVTLDEIPQYFKFFSSIPNRDGHKRLALVVSSVNHHICSNIINAQKEHLRLKIGVFSSVEKALEWLERKDNTKKVNDTFLKVKNQYHRTYSS